MIVYQNKKNNLFKPLEERSELLEDLKKKMEDEKIQVKIDKENGVLQLTNMYYFKKGSYTLNKEGRKDFKKIRKIFNILICYSDLNNPETKKRWFVRYKQVNTLENWKTHCRKKYAEQYGLIDSILIEGHADSTPIGPRLKWMGIETNLDLAMERSKTAFYFLTGYKEATKDSKEKGNYLYILSNRQKKNLFGVTSYGNLRREQTVTRNPSAEDKDRRIDIRFIMSQPEDIREDLKKNLKKKTIK